MGRFIAGWWLMTAAVSSAGCHRLHLLADGTEDVHGTGWISLSMPHARLETNVRPERANAVAWVLEDAALALADTFPPCVVTRPIPPVNVMLFASEWERPDGRSSSMSGHYMGARGNPVVVEPRIIASWGDERTVSQVLAHEMAHHYIAYCYPTAPAWLHEGLAAFYETIDVRADETTVGRPPYRPAHLGERGARLVGGAVISSVRTRLVPPPSLLLAGSSDDFYVWDDRRQAQANYAGAWALVHYGLLGPDPDARRRFRAFLEELTRAESDPRVAFGLVAPDAPSYAALDTAVRSYFSGGRFLERTLARAAPTIEDPVPVDLDDATRREHLAEALLGGLAPELDRARVYLEEAGTPRSVILRAALSTGAERDTLLAEARTREPDSLDLLTFEARLAVEAPMGELASSVLARASSRDDLRATDHVALARLALARGEIEGALRSARAAVAAGPNLWEANLVLGLARRALGDDAHAVSPLRRALFIHGGRTPELAEIERWLVDHPSPSSMPGAPPAPASYGD